MKKKFINITTLVGFAIGGIISSIFSFFTKLLLNKYIKNDKN
jgi:hypothetical protein